MTQSEPVIHWIYQCDDIIVEPHAHRLERAQQNISVEPKAYTVLVTLLENAGEVVERDTLLDVAWGHRHVTSGVLTRAISQLRQALGDCAADPHYIITVHSLGYRFAGNVQRRPVHVETSDSPSWIANEALPLPAHDSIEHPPPSTTRRTRQWLAAATLALVVGGALILLLHGRTFPTGATGPTAPAIVVLPTVVPPQLQNLQPDMDGLVQSLTDQLAVQNNLRVIPIDRVMGVRRPLADARTTARTLGADFALVTELQQTRAGATQLVAQLLPASNQTTSWWTARYHLSLLTLPTLAGSLRAKVLDAIPHLPSATPVNHVIDTDAAADNYWLAQRDWFRFSDRSDADAIHHDEKALAADPGHAPSWCQLGDSYLTLGEGGSIDAGVANARAELVIRRGLSIKPASAECYASLGNLHVLEGRYALAESELQRAIALAPDLLLPHFWLGSAQLAQNRPRDAMRDATAALAERPQLYPLLINIARTAGILGEPAVAEDALARLTETSEPPSTRLRAAAWVAFQYGEPAKATRILMSLIRTGASAHSPAWFHQARFYLAMDALPQAAVSLDNAGKSFSADYWELRVLLLLAQNNPGAAVAFLRQARPPPESAALSHALLAHALALNGDSAAAIREYRTVFATDYTHGDPFLDIEGIDLGPCELANFAALLADGDPTREAIVAGLQTQYRQLRDAGVAVPSLDYRESMLAALQGDGEQATQSLKVAIDRGFRDGSALRRDLAWRALADNPAFQQQQQRLGQLLASEREIMAPVSALR